MPLTGETSNNCRTVFAPYPNCYLRTVCEKGLLPAFMGRQRIATMDIVGKLKKALTDRRTFVRYVMMLTAPLWPDRFYLKVMYWVYMGQRLDLDNPRTFNEKLQWLKLYNRRPEYTRMVDKVAVKEYVASLIGPEHIIPTLGVWERPEDIDFDRLPDRFVLKTSHGGGSNGVVICKDKSRFDRSGAVRKLKKAMKADIWRNNREWPYKHVHRCVLAEELLEDPSGEDLKDYKFFCFNGKVRFGKVDVDRFIGHRANYYDLSWRLLPFGELCCLPLPDRKIDRPENFDRMVGLSEKIAGGIPFVRVDLYSVAGRVYFGETTFFPAAGFGAFVPAEADMTIGRMLELPQPTGKCDSNR